MKNIKFLLIIFIQLAVFQLVTAQVEKLDNGRSQDAKPATKIEQVQEKTVADVLNSNSDEDIPGQHSDPWADLTTVDEGLELVDGRDVLPQNTISADAILAKIEALESEIQALRQNNELLELENRTIRKGMSNCCTDETFDLALEQSFLLQNSPNPFSNATTVKFFMPEDIQDASIEVRDLRGTLLKSFDVGNGGIGEVTIDGASFAQGTYVYTLTVEGKLIDSKVMILTE